MLSAFRWPFSCLSCRNFIFDVSVWPCLWLHLGFCLYQSLRWCCLHWHQWVQIFYTLHFCYHDDGILRRSQIQLFLQPTLLATCRPFLSFFPSYAGHHARWPSLDWGVVGRLPPLRCLTLPVGPLHVWFPPGAGRTGHGCRSGEWAGHVAYLPQYGVPRNQTQISHPRLRHEQRTFSLSAPERWDKSQMENANKVKCLINKIDKCYIHSLNCLFLVFFSLHILHQPSHPQGYQAPSL